jgi:hypothetical protein
MSLRLCLTLRVIWKLIVELVDWADLLNFYRRSGWMIQPQIQAWR